MLNNDTSGNITKVCYDQRYTNIPTNLFCNLPLALLQMETEQLSMFFNALLLRLMFSLGKQGDQLLSLVYIKVFK